jgi:hypothetical protein
MGFANTEPVTPAAGVRLLAEEEGRYSGERLVEEISMRKKRGSRFGFPNEGPWLDALTSRLPPTLPSQWERR